MNHEQQGVLQHDRAVVGEEDGAFGRCFDVAESLAVVGMYDVSQWLSEMHTAADIGQAEQDSCMLRFDVLECWLIDEHRLVGSSCGVSGDDLCAVHHAQDGIDALVASFQVYLMCPKKEDCPQLPIATQANRRVIKVFFLIFSYTLRVLLLLDTLIYPKT